MLNGLKFSFPSQEWKNTTDNSTPGKGAVQKFLRRAVNEGCTHAVVEVTSWGLDQFRVWGVAFDVAVITNLTYEHLDLHGTMEDYRDAKGKLFKALASQRKIDQPKVAVINQDDAACDYYCQLFADEYFLYSTKNKANVWAERAREEGEHLCFDLCTKDGKQAVRLRTRGLFNVANALAAAGAGLGLGFDLPTIVRGLEAVPGVPGRMEFIEQGQPFKLIVDFAHTPNGFTRLFESARAMIGPDKRIIAVYGATGGRDPGRRPLVGEIAAQLIDFSVLTAEDPRHEDPAEIAAQIEVGLNKYGKQKDKDYTFIRDRAEAIAYACQMAQPGDAVLLCSMGDYEVMYVGDGKVPWSDREAAKNALNVL